MTDWTAYDPYHPGAAARMAGLPRSEARRAFERLMTEKPGRIEMLQRLAQANGVDLRGDEGIQALNDWFLANVEPDPASPGRLMLRWYSVATDVALFLGDVIMERCPGLHWEFFTWGKKNVSYQRPVIMGFSRVKEPRFNMDIGLRLAMYGHRIVSIRGSVATLGSATIRGTEVDLDVVTGMVPLEIKRDEFLQIIGVAEKYC